MADLNGNGSTSLRLKVGLAEMLKGGVIMDVIDADQAVIAEQAGAVAVMALERVPAQIRAQGGVARMSHPNMIKEVMAVVSIPVMAKARIGHFVEAQVLEVLGVDFIDESEVLTPADETHHIDKHAFKTPFVCGAKDLGEALRRIAEGAAMIRTKGEPGTGDVIHAVRHMRKIVSEMKALTVLDDQELYAAAKELRAPYELVRMVAKAGKLPVPNFSAGGIATPADAALVRQLGAETVFVGSGIFMSDGSTKLEVGSYKAGDTFRPTDLLHGKHVPADLLGTEVNESLYGTLRNPHDRAEAESRAKAIVRAASFFDDPKIVAECAADCMGAMKGLAVAGIPESEIMQNRGW
jgi:pyridoxal 5'-phosphate synthase pdxS subunit